jgi:hypothetical protein
VHIRSLWSMQRVRLDELVAETVEAMRAQADAHGARVSAAVPDHVVVARADPSVYSACSSI